MDKGITLPYTTTLHERLVRDILAAHLQTIAKLEKIRLCDVDGPTWQKVQKELAALRGKASTAQQTLNGYEAKRIRT